eukprot:TRINITY_DN460_c0_g1_i1.p1 TRINITY_DN460_c0_g1~~TRINITY_DN460_c0_g1_i1.p1  ORF type:complete len:295 (-),score=63.88 TRINITY_DN460_c0_g1_i1:48-932(-)
MSEDDQDPFAFKWPTAASTPSSNPPPAAEPSTGGFTFGAWSQPAPATNPAPTSGFTFGGGSSTFGSNNTSTFGSPFGSASPAPPPRQISSDVDKSSIFKIILVGDVGVGKTTFGRRFLTGDFLERYDATIGIEVHVFELETNKGKVGFKVWDVAADPRFAALRFGHYMAGQAAIIMFDVTSRVTYKTVPNWFAEVSDVCDGIPMVLVGNKVDCNATDRQVQPKQILFHRKKNIPYVNMSVKTNYNIEKPLLHLVRALKTDESIEFVNLPSFLESQIAPEMADALNSELNEMSAE